MKSFKTYLQESISYTYRIPKDRETQLYDFYLWGLYYYVPPTAGKTVMSYHSPSDLQDIDAIINEAIKKITDKQQKDLIKATTLAIASEFRHIKARNSMNDILHVAKKYGVQKQVVTFFSKLSFITTANYTDDDLVDLGLYDEESVRRRKPMKGSAATYSQSYKIWKSSKFDIDKFLRFMYDGFKNLEWNSSFGGDKWAQIVKALQDLIKAKSVSQKIQAIDHIYDIEHNTGTMLNKVQDFAKDSSFSWIKKALEFKKYAHPYELIMKSSVPTRISARMNNMMGFGTLEDFKRNSAAKTVVNTSDAKEVKKWAEKARRNHLGGPVGTVPKIKEIIVANRKNKKYKMLNEDTIVYKTQTLYRIQALKSFGSVKAGDLGGYIGKESNLSIKDTCWAYNFAKVYGNATVVDNASITQFAEVYGNASIDDEATVSGKAVVRDNATVKGKAAVGGLSIIEDNAIISQNALVSGRAAISDDAVIRDNAQVSGDATVTYHALVADDATVGGNAVIGADAFVHQHAKVFGGALVHGNVFGHAQVYNQAIIEAGNKVYGSAKVFGKARIAGEVHISGDAEVSGNAGIFGKTAIFGSAQVKGKAHITGNAKIYGASLVTGKATVRQNALVFGKAVVTDYGEVREDAKVHGNAQIRQSAIVAGNARVYDNAQLLDKCDVRGKAIVHDQAVIDDNAQIFGNAQVFQKAQIFGNAQVYGSAKVVGSAKVYGSAQVYGDALVYDNAKVYGSAKVLDTSQVYDKAQVSGNVVLHGGAQVFGSTDLNGNEIVDENTNF